MKRILEEDKNSLGNYDDEFMGFLGIYYELSKLIPKDWTIVDLGCANGFQAEFFKKHKNILE